METDLIPFEQAPQLAEDVYHYANDAFVQRALELKQEIAKKLTGIKPEDRYIAKELAKGRTPPEVANDLNRSHTFVLKHATNPVLQEIIVMMQHYELLLDGPMEFQRKNMLWRIAVDNEKTKPKFAIDALDKLNKMNKSYTPEGGGGQAINIVINNANLPKGVLDQ